MTAHQTETEAQPLVPQVEEDNLLRGILLALVVKSPRSKADLVAYLTSRHSSDSDVSSLSGDELCLAIDKRLSLLSEAGLIKCQGETITITGDGFQLIELWRSKIEPIIRPAHSPSPSQPEQTNEEILASIREMMVDDGKSSAEQPDTVPPPHEW